MKVIFASNNTGKIRELEAMVRDLSIEIIPQSFLNVTDINETGLSFVENAIAKARHASKITGLPAIADDSGLEVFALHGKPGIYSARYAGANASAQDNIIKLLDELKTISDDKRGARFFCSLVYLSFPEDPTPLICEGVWQGSILKKPSGNNGFGYDPIFYVTSEKCSAAELDLNIKNRLSHRGQALRLLIKKLPEKIAKI